MYHHRQELDRGRPARRGQLGRCPGFRRADAAPSAHGDRGARRRRTCGY